VWWCEYVGIYTPNLKYWFNSSTFHLNNTEPTYLMLSNIIQIVIVNQKEVKILWIPKGRGFEMESEWDGIYPHNNVCPHPHSNQYRRTTLPLQ